MKYSSQKDFNALIKSLVKSGICSFEPKANHKHSCLRFPNGAKLPIPSTPKGDKAALRNFQAQVRRLTNLT